MIRIPAACVLSTVLVISCVISPLAYPPPPESRSGSSPVPGIPAHAAPADLEKSSRLYFLGIQHYVSGNLDIAASRFTEALNLLETPETNADNPASEEEDLLRRKILYLLGKVILNGENEIPWIDHGQVPAQDTGQSSGQVPARTLGPSPETLPDIVIISSEQTERWIKYFSEDAHDRFSTYLERSGRYESMMRSTLRVHGLPEKLVYLPLIESGFNPRAYSSAHAAGIWQFISSTAKRRGLRVDYWVDERRNPEKSCEAAARHLRYLWEIFESWPLVLAAYNAGEKRVMDAVLAGATRDFWKLRLPRQTRHYVPRYMAGALIGIDPETYGFDIDYEPPLAYDIFEVDQATDLEYVAECTASSLPVLKDLNPDLRRACTPPGESGFPVRIPAGTLALCQERFFETPDDQRLAAQSQFAVHHVKQGETLSHIARRYGTTVSQIASANNLKSRNLIHVGQKLTVHTPGGGYAPPTDTGHAQDAEKIVYVVKRGDTLAAIARSYSTHVSNLRKWNGLGRNQHIIHPGDRLLIFLPKQS
ncbi:MAG: LysM peptidoglycan-binding domain-containing protein [Candidatus Eisenbacteria sp.]|nr:LysM peptidoglycan-binding domain-containing protein [Candidatus Eisenbacteria bacterium]